jgi:hypothetical protein
MTIQLNHTIVRARNKHTSAKFLADTLGLPVGDEFGPFVPIKLANGVTLDYMTTADVTPQHYAFSGRRRRVRLCFRPHHRRRSRLLRRGRWRTIRRDQPSMERTWCLLQGPQRARDGTAHPRTLTPNSSAAKRNHMYLCRPTGLVDTQ